MDRYNGGFTTTEKKYLLFIVIRTGIINAFSKEKVVYHFSTLASLNLPAAIENTSGNDLPPSLLEKGDTVKEHGGLKSLQSIFTDLPGLLKRNNEILDEVKNNNDIGIG